jgi:hypothetical protein
MHVMQRILGHVQVSTTRIYTDPMDSLTREAVDRIGRKLWPDAEETQPQMQPGTADGSSPTGRIPRSEPGGAPGGRTLNQRIKSPLLCH